MLRPCLAVHALIKGAQMAKNWIQDMHMKKGSFTKQADKAGKSVGEMAKAHKGDSGVTGKRARLALVLKGLNK